VRRHNKHSPNQLRFTTSGQHDLRGTECVGHPVPPMSGGVVSRVPHTSFRAHRCVDFRLSWSHTRPLLQQTVKVALVSSLRNDPAFANLELDNLRKGFARAGNAVSATTVFWEEHEGTVVDSAKATWRAADFDVVVIRGQFLGQLALCNSLAQLALCSDMGLSSQIGVLQTVHRGRAVEVAASQPCGDAPLE
jgi:hypothetical protein